jgi:hypothetical protein
MMFKLMVRKWFIISLLFSASIYGESEADETIPSLIKKLRTHFFSPDITDLPISDWYNPTVKDYQLIQTFIREKIRKLADSPIAERPFGNEFLNTEFYGWTTYRMNRGNLAGEENDTRLPRPYVIYFNKDPFNKKRCIICYASHGSSGGRNYERGIEIIIESLRRLNFDGHFIFYIGGWPNVRGGRLKYADVPYAFKPFMFEEVRDLGYEQVLWIDACCVPVNNLDPVFKFIEKNGLCFVGYGDAAMPWNEFNRSYKDIMPFIDLQKSYNNLVSQVVGINMRDARGRQLLNAWIKTAEDKVAFLQSDQPPFIFLINDLHLMHGQLPYHYFAETPCNTGYFSYWESNPYAIFYHQYDFVDTQYSLPRDFFDQDKKIFIHQLINE